VTATDASGNSTNVSVIVTVVDTTAPVVTAPGNVHAEATAVLTPLAIGEASATDVFGVTVTSDAPSAFSLGSTLVTWTATDANGNSDQATQTVSVVDTTPPALNVPANLALNATSSAGATVTFDASATDLGGTLTAACVPASGSVFPVGTTTVRCTASDSSGNSAEDEFRTTVHGAPNQIVGLIEEIRRMPLSPAAEARLLESLVEALERPRSAIVVCRALRLFAAVLQLQRGRSIPWTSRTN